MNWLSEQIAMASAANRGSPLLSLKGAFVKRIFLTAIMSFALLFTCNCKGGDGARSGERLKEFVGTLTADSEALIENLPLAYSQSDGFVGESALAVRGEQRVVKASIKGSGAGYVWSIAADENGPALKYEFEMKEKAAKTD